MGLLGKLARPALEGLPTNIKIPKLGLTIEAGPMDEARQIAELYMRDQGLKYDPIKKYAKVNVERARRIADAFDAMKDDPYAPGVQKAYKALGDETIAQYKAIKKYSGQNFSFIPKDEAGNIVDPYAESPRLAIEDMAKNKHLWVFNTEDGYGSNGITPDDIAKNPMLAVTDEQISGRPARVNDLFRAVHDYFGHAKEGVGFRADGEENAWRGHASMYSPDAVPAATTETRGQNSWLNYGPHGEKNRTASTPDTVFADQKIGLLPDWAWREGLKDKDLAALIAIIGGGGAVGSGLMGRVQTPRSA